MRDYTFDSLVKSFSLVQPILEADKAAVAGREVYDDGYFELLFQKVRPILEDRLSDSIVAVASADHDGVGARPASPRCRSSRRRDAAQGQASVAGLSALTSRCSVRR